MMNFIDHLNSLIASNQPDKAMEEIRKAFRDFKIGNPDQAEEIAQLEQQIILHSARMRELDNKERNIQLSSSEIDVARSRMYAALLGIISSFGDYPELKDYLTRIPAPDTPEPQEQPTPQQPAFQSAGFSPAYQQVASPKSNQGTILGVLGTVAVIAVAALIFMFTRDSGTSPATNPGQTQAATNLPATTSSEEDTNSQKESEMGLYHEIRESGTISPDKLDQYLKEFPEGEHVAEIRALKDSMVRVREEKDELLWQLALSKNTVEDFNTYLSQTELGIYSQQAETKRDSLLADKSESERFLKLTTAAEADSLNVQERLALWKSAGDDFSAEHLDSISSRIETLQSLATRLSTIKDDANFVTCRTVSDEKNPIQTSDNFGTGPVYMWARVNAPGRETLKVIWQDQQGNILHERTHSVETNTGLGYRIYSMHSFPDPGTYEVRLFNSEDVLIARRVFEVK